MKKILLLTIILVSLSLAHSCEDRLFTLKSQPLAIKDFLYTLSDECGLSILYEDKFVSKKLRRRIGPLNLKGVTLKELLDILLKENKIDYSLQDNILRLRYIITKTFKIDYVTSTREAQSVTDASRAVGPTSSGNTSPTATNGSGDVNIIKTEDKFDFWAHLSQELKAILNRPEDEYKAPDPIINANAGLITVSATRDQMERIKNYLNTIEDRLHNEVLIDVSILAVLLNKNQTTGIDWSRFALSMNGNYDGNTFTPTTPVATYQAVGVGENFGKLATTTTATTVLDTAFHLSGLINFLKKQGNVITLSNPKILTLNNQPAIISIGDTLNYNLVTQVTYQPNATQPLLSYTPSSVFVGILLNITPEITKDGDIILRINPSVSELKNPQDAVLPENGMRQIAPDTREKKLSTIVKVHDGSTLIFGGLISNTKNFTINGVPIIKDIPLFGELFKSKRRNNQRFELVFVLRPKIVNKQKSFSLKDLGYKKLNEAK